MNDRDFKAGDLVYNPGYGKSAEIFLILECANKNGRYKFCSVYSPNPIAASLLFKIDYSYFLGAHWKIING